MKKFLSLLTVAMMACSMTACDKLLNFFNGTEEPDNTPVAVTLDLDNVTGYTSAIYEYREAGMADVYNNPLVIAYTEETLEYSKVVENAQTYEVYHYTKMERGDAVDGKNGDEALKAVELYKTEYTVVVSGEKWYFELSETDMQILESMDTVYPGVVREMSEATSTEKTEMQTLVNKFLPKNNTLESFKSVNSVSGLEKTEVAKVNGVDANIYATANGGFEVATDANGILFYARSVAKTVLGMPVGQVYYPYLYTFVVGETNIAVDFSLIN